MGRLFSGVFGVKCLSIDGNANVFVDRGHKEAFLFLEKEFKSDEKLSILCEYAEWDVLESFKRKHPSYKVFVVLCFMLNGADRRDLFCIDPISASCDMYGCSYEGVEFSIGKCMKKYVNETRRLLGDDYEMAVDIINVRD